MPEELGEIERLDQLRSLMERGGVTRLFFKRLAPNDNSKNQVYLGGNYSALEVLPYSDVVAVIDRKDAKRDRFKAKVHLDWLAPDGGLHSAPTGQLILYPKYPEVRLSGFLKGCKVRPRNLMVSRDEGRILFMGTKPDGRIVGHVISAGNPLVGEIAEFTEDVGVLVELPLSEARRDTRGLLLSALRVVHERGWIESVKLGRDGVAKPYRAMNGGGYTLEAQLGVVPNGTNEPDYLGWEIKQHKSPRQDNPLRGGPITLMTPEPTGGFYRDNGVKAFVREFGYPDKKGREDRLNFGGVHKHGIQHSLTSMTMVLEGFDIVSGKILDINGGIVLRHSDGRAAAIWYFNTLIEKWARKHAKAAYVPSESRKGDIVEYRYGHVIGLGEKSGISRFLSAIAASQVYYDPGIKLEHASTDHAKVKPRSQFRIKAAQAPVLYESFELVDLLGEV